MTPRFENRPYQENAVIDLRQALREVASLILYAPTGAGKTAIACDITRKSAGLGTRVLFIGDSLEIIEQTSETMDYWGVPHGIIQSGNKNERPSELVHIATIQTLRNRELPAKDLIFVDECHLARARSWHEVIHRYAQSGAKVIGLTATPCRLDQKGLGALFQTIVYCPSIAELTAQGYLVPFKIFAPPAPDVSRVKSSQGDFKRRDLAEVMDKAKLIGNAVEHYARMARGRLAILAASGIEHSQHLTAAFNGAGIPTAHCDGTVPRDVRRQILKSLPARKIMVLCQVDICGKGWDCKEVSCAIDCRPTQSLAKWLQFVGRTIRTANGKEDALLLDHAGNVHRFGFPDDPREWSLEDGVKRQAKTGDTVASITTCRKCFATFRSGPDKCPYCGSVIPKRSRKVETVSGDLEELRREQKAAAIEEWQKQQDGDTRRAKFEEFCMIARMRGYKKTWPAVRFKIVFGHWPPKEWRAHV